MAFLKQSGIVSHICRCLNLYLNPTLKSRMLSTLLKKIFKNLKNTSKPQLQFIMAMTKCRLLEKGREERENELWKINAFLEPKLLSVLVRQNHPSVWILGNVDSSIFIHVSIDYLMWHSQCYKILVPGITLFISRKFDWHIVWLVLKKSILLS